MARTPANGRTASDPLLAAVGERIQGLRRGLGLTRRDLAVRSGLSLRFLGEVESGRGNIAVTRLNLIAEALGCPVAELLREPPASARRLPVVSLLGLRGAGKSGLGTATAAALGLPFQEHDRLVESAAGMDLGEIFSLHGEGYYRQRAREALERFLAGPASRGILAASGGIVADPEAFARLRERTHTVWLVARPRDHWQRVVAQGDFRPMKDHKDAMAALERLHDERRPLYAQAEHHLDTGRLGREAAIARLTALVRRLLALP